MICKRCGKPMYRVMNPDKSAKATCTGCTQYVDCAECSGCHDTKCLGCYNRATLAAGKPQEMRSEPIVNDEEGGL